MKYIHCADIHLDTPFSGLAPRPGVPRDALVASTRRAFTRMIDYALAEAVDFLLIAGDLYDGDWRDFNTGLFFAAEASRLQRADIPVFLLHGNHDAVSQISRSLPLPPNVHLFSHQRCQTHRLEGLRVAVHGMSFGTRAITDNLLPHYPPPEPGFFNIGLLHTAASGREGHEPYAPCALADLITKGYDYWALGHVHAREILHTEPPVVFPGNLQGRNIRETGPKGFMLVTANDGRVRDMHFEAVDLFRWEVLPVDLEGATDLEIALAGVEQACREVWQRDPGHPLCLRVVFQGRTPLHGSLHGDPDALIAACQAKVDLVGAGIWIEKVRVATSLEQAAGIGSERQDETGTLLRVVRDMANDPSALTELQAEFNEMLQRLPAPARPAQAADATLPQEAWAALLEEALALLAYRLGGPEAG
ncbi:MAG: DNA repair exonuclease [Magnetococcales bacterium]|nr:DNA repair exonuclease [Magnetococcales bacterium]